MDAQPLHPEAEYGRLAFDFFVLEQWDATLPSAEQWTSLARRYLALTPRQRFPYHRLASQDPPSPPLTARPILTPHQTLQERNISATCATDEGSDPVWLRLCYDDDPALEASYDAMARSVVGAGEMLVTQGGEFNDATLYAAESLEEGIAKFLERVPEVVDGRRHALEELYEEVEEDQASKGDDVGDQEVVLMYVVDREALREGIIKACFVDRGGKLVWWNRLEPDHVLEFRGGWFAMAGILGEVLEVFGGQDKGALLQI